MSERRNQLRGTARPRAKLEDLGQLMMAALLPRQFVGSPKIRCVDSSPSASTHRSAAP